MELLYKLIFKGCKCTHTKSSCKALLRIQSNNTNNITHKLWKMTLQKISWKFHILILMPNHNTLNSLSTSIIISWRVKRYKASEWKWLFYINRSHTILKLSYLTLAVILISSKQEALIHSVAMFICLCSQVLYRNRRLLLWLKCWQRNSD